MKKVIILNVRRHYGEIDWILPLLYFFKNFEIYTVFDNQLVLNNFKKNKKLFNLWDKINTNFYVKKKNKKFFWKFLSYILLRLNLSKINFFFNLHKKILEKTSELESIEEKFKIDLNNLKYFFISINNLSYLAKEIRKNYPFCKIIRFPESTWPHPSKYQNSKMLIPKEYINVIGDFFLFTSKSHKNFFLGNRKIKNLIYCNDIRYEKWWLKKLSPKKILKKKKTFVILVATRIPIDYFFPLESYNIYIRDILDIAAKYKNIKVTFKPHPHGYEKKILKKILNDYNTTLWNIDNNHPIYIASNSDLCISIITSACFDFLSIKKPTIEYFCANTEFKKRNSSVKSTHLVVKNGKFQTIFESLGVVKSINNKYDLEKKIRFIMENRKFYWKNNYSNFIKYNQKLNSSSIFKILNRIT